MVPDQKAGLEGREHYRAPIELKVDYKKLNSFFADYTKNISKGGTFIKTKKPLPIGTRFLFKLSVPQRPAAFELIGEVVWSTTEGDEPGMGIKFVYSDDTQRSAAWIARQNGKIDSALKAMSIGLADKAFCSGIHFSLSDVAVGCALGYLDFRFPENDWRSQYANLLRLQDKLMQRASFADTRPF